MTATLNGEPVEGDELEFSAGENILRVTAALNGESTTYAITVAVAPTLAALSGPSHSVECPTEFDPHDTSYEMTIYRPRISLTATTTDPSLTVTAAINGTPITVTQNESTYTLNQINLAEGPNVLTVTVSDGNLSTTYTVDVTNYTHGIDTIEVNTDLLYWQRGASETSYTTSNPDARIDVYALHPEDQVTIVHGEESETGVGEAMIDLSWETPEDSIQIYIGSTYTQAYLLSVTVDDGAVG